MYIKSLLTIFPILIDKNFLFVRGSIRNALLYVKEVLATKYEVKMFVGCEWCLLRIESKHDHEKS
jgi:hypothetical protein